MGKQVTKTLIKTDAVAAALQHTENIASPDGKSAESELRKKRTQLARLTDLQDTLFGVEQVARDRVQTERDKLRKRINQLEATVLPVAASYKVFDLEPLTWRDGNGMPRLVAFRLDKPFFHFSTEMYEDRVIKDHYHPDGLPDEIIACYKDVARGISKEARKTGKTVTLEVRFTGAIPDDVRAKIADAQAAFGKEIYIIADAGTPELTYRAPMAKPKPVTPLSIRTGDPLIIGFDGRQFRLIAAFDLTPIEKLVNDRVNGVRSS